MERIWNVDFRCVEFHEACQEVTPCKSWSTVKTTNVGTEDTQNGVILGAGCAAGAFVQAEIRFV